MEEDKPRKSQKDDEEQIAKYRELLQSIQEKEKKQEEKDIGMEIKWVPGRVYFFFFSCFGLCVSIGLLAVIQCNVLNLQ